MNVLVLNSGSSTLKCALFRLPDGSLRSKAETPLWRARVAFDELPGTARAEVEREDQEAIELSFPLRDPGEILEAILPHLWSGQAKALPGPGSIDSVGHRIVHGGDRLSESTKITPEVRRTLEELGELAPLHNAVEVSGIDAVSRLLGPRVPQVAVFDTAFHRTLPPPAFAYPLPHDWLTRGLRRFGFHGISHQYLSRRAAFLLGRSGDSLRLVTCHLGSGCSLAAIAGGRSVDTTMGFTPIEGLMMATRSGSVDPGLLLHVLRRGEVSLAELDLVLNRRSGLLGLSGLSGDMREVLLAIERGDERARLAFEVYVHRIRGGIGALMASLGGLDALVFSGGVGENAPKVREAVCAPLACFGLILDGKKNGSPREDEDVATATSGARILVVRTEEEWEIASECHRLLSGEDGAGKNRP